ncbi:MAG TPA: hypothetical protein VIN72_12635 [Lutibacter sp.]
MTRLGNIILLQKKWKFQGNIDPIDYGHMTMNMLGNIYLVVFETPSTTKIDVADNKMTKFKRGKLTYNLNYYLPVFYFNERIYFFNGRGDIHFLKSEPENQFFGEKITVSSFYKIYNHLIFTISGILILLENGLRYKNKFTDFDGKSLQVIKVLL